MTQDVAQAVLLCLGLWVVTTTVLWLITGIVDTWEESNKTLRSYLKVWSIVWIIGTFGTVILLALGVSV